MKNFGRHHLPLFPLALILLLVALTTPGCGEEQQPPLPSQAEIDFYAELRLRIQRTQDDLKQAASLMNQALGTALDDDDLRISVVIGGALPDEKQVDAAEIEQLTASMQALPAKMASVAILSNPLECEACGSSLQTLREIRSRAQAHVAGAYEELLFATAIKAARKMQLTQAAIADDSLPDFAQDQDVLNSIDASLAPYNRAKQAYSQIKTPIHLQEKMTTFLAAIDSIIRDQEVKKKIIPTHDNELLHQHTMEALENSGKEAPRFSSLFDAMAGSMRDHKTAVANLLQELEDLLGQLPEPPQISRD